MRLEPGPRERQFRTRLVAWLDSIELPQGLRDYGATPTTSDLDSGRAWQRMLYEAGWAALSWPQEHGGSGATLVEQAIFAEELAQRHLPRQLSFVSVELAGPVIIGFGTDAQKARFLEPLLRGDEIWCQLFSEPGAGSDLAALEARADPVEEGWRVTGQKVWTSGAHYADFGLLLARTDKDAVRHQGLSCFLLPMDRPGIEVRPIAQMDGEAKFNEVYLDNVPVERGELLGQLDEAWAVALSILGRERRMLGSLAIGLTTELQTVRELGRAKGRADDSAFRQRWSELWLQVQLLRWTWLRLLSTAGEASDPRMSILKLTSSELQQQVAALAAEVMGPGFVAGDEGAGWRQRLLTAHGATIAGGTSEIQRNILAERVLELPR